LPQLRTDVRCTMTDEARMPRNLRVATTCSTSSSGCGWAIAAAAGRCMAVPAAADGAPRRAALEVCVQSIGRLRQRAGRPCSHAACAGRGQPSPGCVATRAAVRGAPLVPRAARSGQGPAEPYSLATLDMAGTPGTRR